IGMKHEEDSMFNIMAFQNCDSAIFTDYSGYIYIDNVESISRSADFNEKIEIAIKYYNFNYKEYFKLNFSKEEINNLKTYRLINKVSYVVFHLIIDKSKPIKQVFNTGLEIIRKVELQKVFNLVKTDLKLGFFQKLIYKIIRDQ